MVLQVGSTPSQTFANTLNLRDLTPTVSDSSLRLKIKPTNQPKNRKRKQAAHVALEQVTEQNSMLWVPASLPV